MLAPAAGATRGSDLAQPHGQAYLILYPLLFLGARTATWATARQLSAAQRAQRDAGCGEAAAEEGSHPALPPELLPLARGAWLLKLPSGGGGGGGPAGALEAAGSGWSCTSLAAPAALAGWGRCRRGAGGSSAAGRRRFVQLSHDGACMRWDWRRWVLCHHIQALHAW
jgi:hypothetical protein